MKRDWLPAELTEHWALTPGERNQVLTKRGPSRLGFAVLLKVFQYQGRFPKSARDVPKVAIDHLAQQLGVEPLAWSAYDWTGRAIKYHRQEIRTQLGFREATVADGQALTQWLGEHCLSQTRRLDAIGAAAYERLRSLKIEPPTPERLDRLLRSALQAFDDRFCQRVYQNLMSATRERLDALLVAAGNETGDMDVDTASTEPGVGRTPLQSLRADTGAAKLDNVFAEIRKLNRLRALQLPPSLFVGVSSNVLRAYQQRAAVEEPYELRRHPPELRVALLAVYCRRRFQELTDTLVELLITLIHRIGAKAERKVEKALLDDFKRVNGKTGLLFQLAEASLDEPDGVVKEVIYPVVSEPTLKAIVKEWRSTGPLYRSQVQTRIRSSYRSHYRRMLAPLLNVHFRRACVKASRF